MERTLDEKDLFANPILHFQKWFGEAQAAHVAQPDAMTLATATADGRPSARMVLLKGVDGEGFRFYTNYRSRKGMELDKNPYAALVFHWVELEAQVRIEGDVSKTSREESERYFHSRPRLSQISASISVQSQIVGSRPELESRARDLEQRTEGGVIPLPSYWGGYLLRPHRVEFWQGRPGRLHDRILYLRLQDGSWSTARLAP